MIQVFHVFKTAKGHVALSVQGLRQASDAQLEEILLWLYEAGKPCSCGKKFEAP